MVAHKFAVLLEPAEEGGFVVKCLELPVATEGETKEEALRNIKEAIEGYLEAKIGVSLHPILFVNKKQIIINFLKKNPAFFEDAKILYTFS